MVLGKFTGHLRRYRESLRRFTAFSGHFRRFRESLGRDRESFRLFPVILGVFRKVYGFFSGRLWCYRESLRWFTAFSRSFEAFSGKFTATTGKFTGHLRRYRESLRTECCGRWCQRPQIGRVGRDRIFSVIRLR